MTNRLFAVVLLLPALASALPVGEAMHRPADVDPNQGLPDPLKNVGIEEKLGSQLPLDARFTSEDGAPVRLGDVVPRNRPVLLSLVYFNCPMLCGLILTGAARAMRETGLTLGKDFDAVTISFDPTDTPQLAAERQRGYLQAFGNPQATRGWTFLTGREPDIRAVTDAVGFRYAYDAKSKQYAHVAAIFVLTPGGQVSRYLYGIEFPAKDVRLALIEASQGRVGTSLDRLLLTCFRYDASTRKYEPYILGIVRLVMLSVLGGLGVLLGVLWRRDLKGRRRGVTREEPNR